MVFLPRLLSYSALCAAVIFLTGCSPSIEDPKVPVPSQTTESSVNLEISQSKRPYQMDRRDIFIANKDLEAQRSRGFKPRKDTPPYPLDLPIAWDDDPFSDRNWRYQLNAWRMIDPYIDQYYKKKNPELLFEALDYIRDWYDFHIVEGKPNDYAWYDMSKGLRGIYIALFISLDRDGTITLETADRDMLQDLAARHVKKTHEIKISPNNHGLFQLAGLTMICSVEPEKPYCENELAFAQEQIKELLDKQFTSQGIHVENSPSYHYFVYNSVQRIGALRGIVDPETMATIRANRGWLAFPNRRIAQIGDSAGNTNPLDSDLGKECLGPDACYSVGRFEESGYAIIRDLPSQNPDSMIFVTGMSHNTVHSHTDPLSFELFEFGRMIFVDGGKYGFNNDEKRRFITSPRAHNTLSLAQKKIIQKQIKLVGSQLEEIKTIDGAFVIQGEAEYPGILSFRRTLEYRPEKSLRITDKVHPDPELLGNPKERIISNLQLAPDLTPVMTENGFRVKIGNRQMQGTLISKDCVLQVSRGQVNPYSGWYSPEYLVIKPLSTIKAICKTDTPEIVWDIAFD